MPVTKRYKSKQYLNFLADHRCVITGASYNVDLHHEAVTRRFGGSLKKSFDFGAIPLSHDIHIDERHAWGRHEFWRHYEKDPEEIAINLIEEYLTMEPEDEEVAREALELIQKG